METSKVRPVKKFMGGRYTPQEVHAAYAFPLNARCNGCGAPPTMRALLFIEAQEALKRGMLPDLTAFDAETTLSLEEKLIRTLIHFKGPSGPVAYFRFSITYSCPLCRHAMHKELAKVPSYMLVEINEGPDPKNRLVLGYH